MKAIVHASDPLGRHGDRAIRRSCRARRIAAIVCVAWAASTTSVARAHAADAAIDADTDPWTASQRAAFDQVDRLRDGFLRSSDLRLRILHSVVHGVKGDDVVMAYTEELVPAPMLYEQARGSTDPLVLDLLIHRCPARMNAPDRCDRVALARRWTEADTQNQVAWLTLSSLLKEQGDREASRDAFLRAARMSRWHEHVDDLARLIAAAIPKDLSPQARNGALTDAMGRGIPFDVYQLLGDYCQEDDLRAACGQIVRTMARDTDLTIGLAMAVRYAARAKLDPDLVAAYRRESDAIHWISLAEAPAGNWFDETDDETQRRFGAWLQARIDAGERRFAERALAGRRIAKSDAAARYVATLTPSQLQRRAAESR